MDTMYPEPTRLLKLSKPLLLSRLRFWKLCSGISGDCHVQNSGAFSTLCRPILRGGNIAWRILRNGTLGGPARSSFDSCAEGAMTTGRPLLTLLIRPSPFYCHRTAVSACFVTLRGGCLTLRTLCQRREEGYHDPQEVLAGIPCYLR